MDLIGVAGTVGPAALRRRRADPTPGIPAIALTTRARPPEAEPHRLRGALAVIAEPFDPMNRATQLRQAVGDGRQTGPVLLLRLH